ADREIIVATGEPDCRGNYVVPIELERQVGIIGGTHDLVQLLSGTYPDDLPGHPWRDDLGQVGNTDGGNSWNEDFAAMHALEVAQDEIDPLLQGDPEP